MDPQFWRERWQRGEIGWHRDDINPHLQEHWPRVQAPKGCDVFVPLCGKSLDLLWLAGEGHRVVGVEISALAVAAFFEENGLQPSRTREGALERWTQGEITILHGDYFDLTAAHLASVEAVFDRASLVALPPELRPRYVGHLDIILPQRPPTLLITMEYDQREMQGPPFAVHQDEVRALYAPRHAVEPVASHGVLAENARFRQRGLTALVERVYRLTAAQG